MNCPILPRYILNTRGFKYLILIYIFILIPLYIFTSLTCVLTSLIPIPRTTLSFDFWRKSCIMLLYICTCIEIYKLCAWSSKSELEVVASISGVDTDSVSTYLCFLLATIIIFFFNWSSLTSTPKNSLLSKLTLKSLLLQLLENQHKLKVYSAM